MSALPWAYLALLSLGYALALSVGHLGLPSLIAFALLLASGAAAFQQRNRPLRYLGHGLFLLVAAGLALHWLPGFGNGRMISAVRFTPDAVPFTLYLNLDKPLIGFWLLLVCPWLVRQRPPARVLGTTAIAGAATSLLALGGAVTLGIVDWAPKWPEQGWLWLLNNLLLVSLVEEILFRGYIQGGLGRCFKSLPRGETLALLGAALIFGLAHLGAGWQWVLLATLAGVGYGLAYRFGGLAAAIATHVALNTLHFVFFTYPMLQP
ncbi:CPBP family intramembrane metalloprotease [Pseudomonas gingeri]|uniref:CPBP family intramembrane glutamic endopeptidase n=1 Tax=Pseudomonas gingeri TaxID=117681 RepID=UPI0015A3E069|nr:type II CAAX endopeptidase family protein [Pseudomonas gingeri]NWE49969.1 CPBP family intramembrane metalloprotease [Pseudomonas gingeri]NWE70497.1 CPBP family intramembrane metalloprotease [Pseudomonas gingeri]